MLHNFNYATLKNEKIQMLFVFWSIANIDYYRLTRIWLIKKYIKWIFNSIIRKNFMLCCINILYEIKSREENKEQGYVKKHNDIILEVLWYNTSSLT